MVLYPAGSISPMRCVSAKWLLLGIISTWVAPSVTGTSRNVGTVVATAGDGAAGGGVALGRLGNVGAAVGAKALMDAVGVGVAGGRVAGVMVATVGGVADGCCIGPDGDA